MKSLVVSTPIDISISKFLPIISLVSSTTSLFIYSGRDSIVILLFAYSFALLNNSFLSSLGSSSNKSKEVIDISTEGEGEFSFSFDFVTDYLSQENDENICFKYVPYKCLIFDKENYRHVLSINN